MGHRSAFLALTLKQKMLIDRMIRANIIFVAKETFPLSAAGSISHRHADNFMIIINKL